MRDDKAFIRVFFPTARVTSVEVLDLRAQFTVPPDLVVKQAVVWDRFGLAASVREGRCFYLIRNSYIASFFRHLAIGALYARATGQGEEQMERIAIDRFRSSIKRTQAEVMYARDKALPAVAQFLEALIDDEGRNQQIYEWLDGEKDISLFCTRLTEFVLDLIMAHEIGHICRPFDRRHFDVVQDRISDACEGLQVDERLRQEIECDVFAMNVLLAKYASSIPFETMLNYLNFATISQFAFGAMVADAEDFLEKNDREGRYQQRPGTLRTDDHQARFTAVTRYLADFPFQDEEMFRSATGAFPQLPHLKVEWVERAFQLLDNAVSPGTRSVARLLGEAFLSGKETPFDYVIENGVQEIEMLIGGPSPGLLDLSSSAPIPSAS